MLSISNWQPYQEPHFARYYLRSLEMAVKKEPDPYFIPNDDQSVITLEHVLPEKPGANWPQFTLEAHAAVYRRLGNMALLRAKKNSDLHSVRAPRHRDHLFHAIVITHSTAS